MDAPESTPTPPPPVPLPAKRWLSRRTFFKLAGGAATIGFAAEFLRVVAFSNVHTVIPGRVYRTAQRTPEQLQKLIAEKHIRTVVNLRGVCSDTAWYLGECQTTHTANINQEDITFSAKRYPAPAEIQRLIDVFDHTAYPIVMHCQRGADRTGLASVVARLLMTSDSLSAARRQLWPRYGHAAVGRTAVLDVFFDLYEAWLAAHGESHTSDRFRRWVATDYCPGPFRANLSLLGPVSFPTGRGFTVGVRAVNASIEPWRFTTGSSGGIRLLHSLTTSSAEIIHRGYVGQLARTVPPGEHIDLTCGFPPLPAGKYMFSADLVDAAPIDLLNTAFVQYGSEPLQVTVTVS